MTEAAFIEATRKKSPTWYRLSDGAPAYEVVLDRRARFRRRPDGEMLTMGRGAFEMTHGKVA